MALKGIKSLLVAVLGAFLTISSFNAKAQHEEHKTQQHTKEGFNAKEVIFGHIMDGHEFHFFDYKGHPYTIPLPVILFSPQKGLSVFMSSQFEHGHKEVNGYKLIEGKILS